MGQDFSRLAQYDQASGRWRDKMRALGYYDAYLGFLSEPGPKVAGPARVIDVGSGSGAFAEAWVAVNGTPSELVLLDPSEQMLARGQTALARYGVTPQTVATRIEDAAHLSGADEVLAAHVIEHSDAPLSLLGQLRDLLSPGGRLRLVVSKPHWCNAIIWLKWRHRSYPPTDFRDLLGQAGLELESEYAFPAGPPSRTSRGYVARIA